MDRIAKHQAVCLKLRKKRPVFQAQRQRVFLEAGRLGVSPGPLAPRGSLTCSAQAHFVIKQYNYHIIIL